MDANSWFLMHFRHWWVQTQSHCRPLFCNAVGCVLQTSVQRPWLFGISIKKNYTGPLRLKRAYCTRLSLVTDKKERGLSLTQALKWTWGITPWPPVLFTSIGFTCIIRSTPSLDMWVFMFNIYKLKMHCNVVIF